MGTDDRSWFSIWLSTHLATKDALEHDLPKHLRERRSQPPRTLYHFTSAAGLLGILESRTLRLTRAVCSNDASEVRHVVRNAEFMADVLLESARSGEMKDRTRESLQHFAQRMKEYRDGWSGERQLRSVISADLAAPDPYIACFCDGDHQQPTIVHWGHYGRAGEGCAIEIDTTQLPADWQGRFVKVSYDTIDQFADLDQVFAAFLLNQNDFPESDVGARLEAVIRALAVTKKDSVFELENEWRVTWLNEVDGALDIRVRNEGPEIVSFVEMPISLAAIRRITLGTKRDVRRSGGSLAAFLKHLGANEVVIDESTIPFR